MVRPMPVPREGKAVKMQKTRKAYFDHMDHQRQWAYDQGLADGKRFGVSETAIERFRRSEDALMALSQMARANADIGKQLAEVLAASLKPEQR